MDWKERVKTDFSRLLWEENFSFSRHTAIGCGGNAALAVSPPDPETAAALLFRLGREGIPHILLGAGANVLPSERFFEGVVVRFSAISQLRREGEFLFAGAGVTGGALCRFARGEELGGFEPFTGIPMTVGGGIAMNAGVAEGHFSDVTERVLAAERGRLRVLERADCAFSEKNSLFLGGVAVMAACLRGIPRGREEIAAQSALFAKRRERLPKGRSMGCVFVNPKGDYAGRLIEQAGLKGVRVGGARVSERHANFILNEGGSSLDVKLLIRLIKERVMRETGVLLREEIRYLP